VKRFASTANPCRAERVVGKGSAASSMAVVVARERVAAEELVGGSLGIGLTGSYQSSF
jgi:hypothetical protein